MFKSRSIIIIIALALPILWYSCKSDPIKNMPELSLMDYGIPLTIKAPEGAEVKKGDLGIFQDVTVKSGENFYIQILGSEATNLNVAEVKNTLLEDIKLTPYFSKVVEEYDEGFIFQKQIDSTNINYAFRHIKIQGDKEYIFQTGMIGKFELEDVRTMYDAVK